MIGDGKLKHNWVSQVEWGLDVDCRRKITPSDFRLHYDRGDLPVLVKHERGTSIQWKDPTFDKFNYQLFLPIFVDGIREVTDPYRFIAIRGTFDILDHVKDNIVKIIPQLILPLKTALA